jgi:CubicO group peptidase (beta-lactamase class C family)
VETKQRIDQLLRGVTERRDVPGIIAVAARRDGSRLYEGAFGVRSLAGDEPMTLDTVVWLASMTKALTGAAAMQLVERGEVSLDAPAREWLPLLADVEVLEGFDADGKPVLRPPARAVTLRHLLSHTSGYAYEFWDADIQRYQEFTGLPPMISGATDALRMPLRFDPGDRWNYGIGIDFAGRIVEQISGLRLGEYLRRELFEPLQMNNSAFKLTPSMAERMASVHLRQPDGVLVPSDLVIDQEPGFDMGGGAVYSTADDYLRFALMILNGGELDGMRVLRPETVAEMSRNQLGPLRTVGLPTAMPHMTGDFEFFPGVPKGWGLTFQINLETAPTGRSPGSLAWAGLCNSYYWIDPSAGVCGVYFSQILPFIDPHSYPAYEAFETAVYDHIRQPAPAR